VRTAVTHSSRPDSRWANDWRSELRNPGAISEATPAQSSASIAYAELEAGARRRILEAGCVEIRAGQRVETGERLGIAVDVEELGTRGATIVAEDEELAEVVLERAAADAIRARCHESDEQRVGVVCDDVHDAPVQAVGRIDQRALAAQIRRGAAHGAKSDATVIDEGQLGRDRTGHRVGVERTEQRRDGLCHGRGAAARRAVRKLFGATRVQLRERLVERSGAKNSLCCSRPCASTSESRSGSLSAAPVSSPAIAASLAETRRRTRDSVSPSVASTTCVCTKSVAAKSARNVARISSWP
jgi:hypothetical protein